MRTDCDFVKQFNVVKLLLRVIAFLNRFLKDEGEFFIYLGNCLHCTIAVPNLVRAFLTTIIRVSEYGDIWSSMSLCLSFHILHKHFSRRVSSFKCVYNSLAVVCCLQSFPVLLGSDGPILSSFHVSLNMPLPAQNQIVRSFC